MKLHIDIVNGMFSSQKFLEKINMQLFDVWFFSEASTPFELINLLNLFYLLNVLKLEEIHLR